MLSKPKYGWTNIQIGSFCDRASYLTDVPLDFLRGVLSLINGATHCTIYIDAEGYDYIVVYENSMLILKMEIDFDTIDEKIRLSKSLYSFALEIYEDITKYLDSWLNWMNMVKEDKETNRYKKRKEEIYQSLKEIELFLEKNKKGC